MTPAETLAHLLREQVGFAGLAARVGEHFEDGFDVPDRHSLAHQRLQNPLHVSDRQQLRNELVDQACLRRAHASYELFRFRACRRLCACCFRTSVRCVMNTMPASTTV